MRLRYVSTTQGPRETKVLCEIRGLAVTESPKGEGWSVTHLNTGHTIVAGEFRDDTARRLCQALAALTNWEELSFDGVVRWLQFPTSKAAVRKAAAAARAEDAS